MRKTILLLFLQVFNYYNTFSQNKEVKNVILMIPDGTSSSIVTLARWYKAYSETTLADTTLQRKINNGLFPPLLSFEEYLCGAVMTHSANGLLSESAPAATEMATGKKSDPGFLGVASDSTPYITNLELARVEKKKSTGLVFSCEFPHATPAAFSSHCLSRGDYKTIKKQMIYSGLNVVFGGGYGGYKVAMPEDKKTLESLGYTVFRNFQDLNNFNGEKTWGLFNTDTAYSGYLAFDLDRQSMNIKEPSISEMTSKAIELLERNKEGFFLMVEGSKVDWAAHLNDPVGVITEFLAFEKAVRVALEYAKKNKNTVVIVCADHATGGFSIGNKFSEKKTNYNNDSKYIQYNHLPYKTIVDNLKMYSLTGDGFERFVETKKQFSDTALMYLKKYYPEYYRQTSNILNRDSINNYFNNKKSDDRKLSLRLGINNYISENAYIGWTTQGHTGEDVPLYIYHPNGFTMHGLIDNTQIADYINELLGVGSNNGEMNKKYFSAYELRKIKNYSLNNDTLLFSKANFNYKFIINTNLYYVNGSPQHLHSLILNIGNKLYAPEEVINKIK